MQAAATLLGLARPRGEVIGGRHIVNLRTGDHRGATLAVGPSLLERFADDLAVVIMSAQWRTNRIRMRAWGAKTHPRVSSQWWCTNRKRRRRAASLFAIGKRREQAARRWSVALPDVLCPH